MIVVICDVFIILVVWVVLFGLVVDMIVDVEFNVWVLVCFVDLFVVVCMCLCEVVDCGEVYFDVDLDWLIELIGGVIMLWMLLYLDDMLDDVWVD